MTTRRPAALEKGPPGPSTTGVDRASSSQSAICGATTRVRDPTPERGPHLSNETGSANANPPKNAGSCQTSSRFGGRRRQSVIGSSAMPQIGQLPGPSWTTSGCIGQVKNAELRRLGDVAITPSILPLPRWRYQAGVMARSFDDLARLAAPCRREPRVPALVNRDRDRITERRRAFAFLAYRRAKARRPDRRGRRR